MDRNNKRRLSLIPCPCVRSDHRALSIKFLIMKVTSIILSVICLYRLLHTTDLTLQIFGGLFTILIISFTFYLLFEEKIVKTSNGGFFKKYEDIATLLFYVFGCYFVELLFIAGCFLEENIFFESVLTTVIFYSFMTFFGIASIYFTIILFRYLICNHRKRSGHKST